ncbi:hypothetical protein C8J56DRAFT_712677, partial [Mycena floridula]
VTVIHMGHPRCPHKILNPGLVQDAMDQNQNIHKTVLAKGLGLHRNTLHKYSKEYGIGPKYSDISDEDLDRLVKAYRDTKSDLGVRYLVIFLCKHSFRVQKARIKASIDRVDPLGQAL